MPGDTDQQPPAGAAVIAVVGPTASGKSDLGVALALELGGEVVNADAMQLYRGMDIGTAKLTPQQRRGVPHHLLDVLEVRQEASLAAFQRDARAALDDIAGRGRPAIVVGGSGLYLRAVLDPLDIPPTDPAVRARLEAELARAGPAALHARLAGLDPGAASRILPSNGRRIVRALEVMEITGGRFRAELPPPRALRSGVSIGLRVPREVLDARIAARVERMWRDGLLEETRALVGAGLPEGRTASRALGYSQALRRLAGEVSEPEAISDTVRATRRFARRQESWFRRDRRVVWLPFDAPDLLARALGVIDRSRSLAGA